MTRRTSWILLFTTIAVVVLWIATPVYLIMPFRTQSPAMLAVSYFLRRWSPWVAPGGLLVGGWALVRLWGGSRIWQRGLATLTIIPLGAAAWFARQNHFEWMFVPLSDPAYVRGVAAEFVNSGDMVLGVVMNGDAAAWPVNQLAYHHVVNTEVGGVPIAATY